MSHLHDSIITAFYLLIKIASTLLLIIFTKLMLTKEIPPQISNQDSENYFYTCSQKQNKKRFPRLLDSKTQNQETIDISIVIPAYNEQDRIKICLDEIIEFFKQKSDQSYEIIVCNDGSKDKTSEITLSYTDKLGCGKNGLRLLELAKNRGKGGAVRKGVLAARGNYILMCDADGATKFSEVDKVIKCLEARSESKYGKVVVGSRAHLAEESIAERTLLRTILMRGFHLLVKYIGNVHTVQDTQCGFKLFTKSSAKFLFSNLHIERWAFDVELLYLSESYGIDIGEVPVHWTEIDGSKLTPLTAAIQMARDLVLLRLYYIFGIYKVKSQTS